MPSSVLLLVLVAAVSFATGVVVCRQLSTLHNYDHKIKGRKEIEDEYEDSDEDDEEDDVEIDSRDLNLVGGEVRMTLVVRQDLKMGKGKAAAQCLHATLALYKKITSSTSASYNPQMVQRWERNGQAKITLQVPDQETMDMLFAQAMSIGVNAAIIHDAGRTQIAAGSATVLGLGPAPKAVLDQITGDLKLY
ncbi:Gluconate transport-inducing protein [Naganishia cerealis]|uniref:Gluconate transport-inducing protein n=1 Tax=Naganishia cerealis TaxID=610337 RepID=A0ACC2VXW7_9TREE|nr:Gluconate transport-inducing protein [Naganishia cerealis]